MNCRRVRSLFSEYRDGALRAKLGQDLGGHLAECPRCREEYRRFETGIKILKKLEPIGRPRPGRTGPS